MTAVERGDMICNCVCVCVFRFPCNVWKHARTHMIYVCVRFCECVSMSSEHVFTVKSRHVQPHKELIGFSLFFNRDFLVKIEEKKKCFRCFWSILIACAASVTPWPWIHTQTHTHIVPPSFSWMNLLLELVGNWSAIPCGRRLTLFVMFNDLVSLWQDMMSLYKRNKELWLFDSSFPQWTLHNDVYTNEHTCRSWTSNSRLQLGSKSIWLSSKKTPPEPCTVFTVCCTWVISKGRLSVIFCCSFIPHYPKPHRGWSCVTDIPHCNYTSGFQILFVPISIFKFISELSFCFTWKSCLSTGLP